ncbi:MULTISPECIES: carboxymuconolactone decarboxylase family protein [Cedecea]|jgi:4-carboxymuconolactone decarboxylase|uniref:carboxymuconolactone decarboxylase family protein n=1 Tax=Cedecea TaxID=158483 RepID=UPI00068A2CB5|nr:MULTISPECIES: carboxymuconolactone decarboxylase family protein [Cedecea]NWC61906.1 carboxymuconolactone decarboxylase family protein [Cedecea sp. P7760]
MSETSDEIQRVLSRAPKLASMSNELLFKDIWERPLLNKRERSLITVAALLALYRLEQLPIHFELAGKHGVTHEELSELITHLAFYAGWPAAHSALKVLDAVIVADSQEEK